MSGKMHFIIFEILQDFTPKCFKSHFWDSIFQNIPGWHCPRNATASKCKVYNARYHKEEERWKLLWNYKSMAMVHNYAHFRVFVTRDWSWHKYLINMCDTALVCAGFPADLDPSQNGPPGPNPPANMDRTIRYPLANMGQYGSWFAFRKGGGGGELRCHAIATSMFLTWTWTAS
jgi:hypothetical protein